MHEREIKLGAPLGFRMPELSSPGGDLVTGGAETTELDADYYDTTDLRLARTSASLRHRNDEGWAVKLPHGVTDDGFLDRVTFGFPGDAGEPPVAALDLVRGIVRTQPVAKVAHLHTTRRVIRVYALDGSPVAELTDDDVEVRDGDHLVDRFRELEIEMVSDLPTERVDDIIERLRAAGARPPEPTPKIVRALGPRAQDPPDLVEPDVGADSGLTDVLRAALAASVAKLIAHDPGVRSGGDPEDVHQARVATRRLRSHLRTFHPVLDEQWADALRDELQWLGGLLGAVRDAEVLKQRLADKVELLPEADRRAATLLLRSLDADREQARTAVLDAMRSDRYVELLERLVAAARAPQLRPRDDESDRNVLRGLAGHPLSNLRDAVEALPDDPPDEALHDVRKRAKRARYAAEAVAPVFGKPARRLVSALTAVQDVLGEHQDAVIAADWLRHTSRAGDDRGLAFVAGELVVLEREAEHRARAAWPKTWKEADNKKLRSWL